MKKYIPNIISSSRITGAIILFFFSDFTPVFLGIYIFCGITDLIDGPIARKTNTTSILGAALDTIGDVLTYLAMVKVLIMQELITLWVLVWLAINIIIGFMEAELARRKFSKFYLPHTYLGKSLGGIIFILPLAMQFVDGTLWMAIILVVMSVNLIEILYIQLKSEKAEDFIPSAFHIKREKSA